MIKRGIIKKADEKLVNRYYSPKTYGVEGLSFNGFNIDQIFGAGASVFQEGILPKNTWELFIFHITKSLLAGFYSLMEHKYFGFQKTKVTTTTQPLDIANLREPTELDQITPTPDVENFRVEEAPSSLAVVLMYIYSVIRATTSYFLCFCSDTGFLKDTLHQIPFLRNKKSVTRTAFMNAPTAAKIVTVVLTSHEFIAPPPPLEPNEVLSSSGSQRKIDAKDIALIRAKIAKYEAEKSSHLASDYKRLLIDSTELIYYSTVASLDRLNIFEATGTLSKNPELLAKQVKRKFETVSIGSTMSIPDIVFLFPSIRVKVEMIHGIISTVSTRNSAATIKPMQEKNAAPWNRCLEVVVLERRDGKKLATSMCRKLCSIVDQGLLKSEEFEGSLERVFEEAYITPAADLVVTSGIACNLQGLSPLNMKGSVI